MKKVIAMLVLTCLSLSSLAQNIDTIKRGDVIKIRGSKIIKIQTKGYSIENDSIKLIELKKNEIPKIKLDSIEKIERYNDSINDIKKLNRLIKKYGKKYGVLVHKGVIFEGMTCTMMKDANGSPKFITEKIKTDGTKITKFYYLYNGGGYMVIRIFYNDKYSHPQTSNNELEIYLTIRDINNTNE